MTIDARANNKIGNIWLLTPVVATLPFPETVALADGVDDERVDDDGIDEEREDDEGVDELGSSPLIYSFHSAIASATAFWIMAI